jgi:hypothetical protein
MVPIARDNAVAFKSLAMLVSSKHALRIYYCYG